MCVNFVNSNAVIDSSLFYQEIVLYRSEIMLLQQNLNAKNYQKFKAFFEINPRVVRAIWGLIKHTLPKDRHPYIFCKLFDT